MSEAAGAAEPSSVDAEIAELEAKLAEARARKLAPLAEKVECLADGWLALAWMEGTSEEAPPPYTEADMLLAIGLLEEAWRQFLKRRPREPGRPGRKPLPRSEKGRIQELAGKFRMRADHEGAAIAWPVRETRAEAEADLVAWRSGVDAPPIPEGGEPPRHRRPRGEGAVFAYWSGFRGQLVRDGKKHYTATVATREAAEQALAALVAEMGPPKASTCTACGAEGHNARTCPGDQAAAPEVPEAPTMGVDAARALPEPAKNPAAVALGRRGGAKGGAARAAALSPERRSEIARAAAAARWDRGPAAEPSPPDPEPEPAPATDESQVFPFSTSIEAPREEQPPPAAPAPNEIPPAVPEPPVDSIAWLMSLPEVSIEMTQTTPPPPPVAPPLDSKAWCYKCRAFGHGPKDPIAHPDAGYEGAPAGEEIPGTGGVFKVPGGFRWRHGRKSSGRFPTEAEAQADLVRYARRRLGMTEPAAEPVPAPPPETRSDAGGPAASRETARPAVASAAGPKPAPSVRGSEEWRRRVGAARGTARCGVCNEIGHRADNARHRTPPPAPVASEVPPAPAAGHLPATAEDAEVLATPEPETHAPAMQRRIEAMKRAGDDVAVPALERARQKLRILDNESRQRSRTIPARNLSRDEQAAAQAIDYPADVVRPITRGDCADMPRPCPFVSCSHHLYLEVNGETGAIKLNFPHLDVHEMKESCVLDVADRGGITLEEVGEFANVTRERVRQIEARTLEKLNRKAEAFGLSLPDDGPAGYGAAG